MFEKIKTLIRKDLIVLFLIGLIAFVSIWMILWRFNSLITNILVSMVSAMISIFIALSSLKVSLESKTISEDSLDISRRSKTISEVSDEKMETIGKENTLRALGDFEDARLELKELEGTQKLAERLQKSAEAKESTLELLELEITKKVRRIPINIWKSRTYFERIKTLEEIGVKFLQKRKIRYVHLYFLQLENILKKYEDKLNGDLSEPISQIDDIYDYVQEINEFEDYDENDYPDKSIDRSINEIRIKIKRLME